MIWVLRKVEHFDQCRWPDLPEPFAASLKEAVSFILARFRPIGIFAAGTIVRGAPDASSDLDLYVVHEEPFRQRLQRRSRCRHPHRRSS